MNQENRKHSSVWASWRQSPRHGYTSSDQDVYGLRDCLIPQGYNTQLPMYIVFTYLPLAKVKNPNCADMLDDFFCDTVCVHSSLWYCVCTKVQIALKS